MYTMYDYAANDNTYNDVYNVATRRTATEKGTKRMRCCRVRAITKVNVRISERKKRKMYKQIATQRPQNYLVYGYCRELGFFFFTLIGRLVKKIIRK